MRASLRSAVAGSLLGLVAVVTNLACGGRLAVSERDDEAPSSSSAPSPAGDRPPPSPLPPSPPSVRDAGAPGCPEGFVEPADGGACEPRPVGVVVGIEHACAVAADGHVRCWGGNSRGQLGLGPDAAATSVPTPVPSLDDVSQLAATESRSTCARRKSGVVVCWGANESGQLGDGTTTDRPTPTAVVGLSDVAEVAAGIQHACARRTDGTVLCWGKNDAGQLGDGTTASRLTPVEVLALTGAVQLAVGYRHTCARLADGRVRCWGLAFSGLSPPAAFAPTTVAVPPVKDISSARDHTCFALTDGTARCMGGNDLAQLGNGTTNGGYPPKPVGTLTGVARIFSGGMTGCALLAGGEVWCWGSATGDGATNVRLSPVGPILSGVRTLGLGGGVRCAIAGGELLCWGLLDDAATIMATADGGPSLSPVKVPWP